MKEKQKHRRGHNKKNYKILENDKKQKQLHMAASFTVK
jgi:hypothetical protein